MSVEKFMRLLNDYVEEKIQESRPDLGEDYVGRSNLIRNEMEETLRELLVQQGEPR